MQQTACVRGSPVLRFLLLSLALLATGVALSRITSAKSPVTPAALPIPSKVTPPTEARVRLTLSAPAASVTIDPGTGNPRTWKEEIPTSEKISLNAENPTLAIQIKWLSPPQAQSHHFAKLTVELPGQPTFVQVFDATGDMDEFVELPLRTSP